MKASLNKARVQQNEIATSQFAFLYVTLAKMLCQQNLDSSATISVFSIKHKIQPIYNFSFSSIKQNYKSSA